jgi:hypothetical protein
MNRERRSHEDGVKRLALDQPGILKAAVLRIHRRKQPRRPEDLQGINRKIQRHHRQHDEQARGEETQEVFDRLIH